MAWENLLIGALSFVVIGFFHPVVIKVEYRFGKGVWPVCFVMGVLLAIAALFFDGVGGICLALVAFSSFWSIHELFEQEKRVAKGWFPANPMRRDAGAKSVKRTRRHQDGRRRSR